MDRLETFNKRIYKLRKQSGLTQTQVAEKLGVTYQCYQAYERGVNIPPLDKVVKLADYFNVEIDYLVGRKDI